jgi:predicted MPP superfamily phosphohydrolase
LLLVSSFIIGRTLENFWLSKVSSFFVWTGSFWLGAMLYFFLAAILVDIARLINFWIPFFNKLTTNYLQLKQLSFLAISAIVLFLIMFGYINALNPKVRKLELSIAKESSLPELNVVAASDFHLGTIVGRNRFCKIVDEINKLKPDIILLIGDIVDEDIAPVIKQNLGNGLTNLKSKYGVFAVTGNHEYIGGVKVASQYLIDHGVRVISDSAVEINDDIIIIGREDLSINQFLGKKRKSLEELVEHVDKSHPIILLDHQPFRLEEAVKNGIDLQLSGHTHHGQLFPFNFITKAVFEKSWGYLKKETTHFYVSSGVGTWGPPLRIGNSPEIVFIKLIFQTTN